MSSPLATQGRYFTVKLEGLWDYMALGGCPVFLSSWWYRNLLVVPMWTVVECIGGGVAAW